MGKEQCHPIICSLDHCHHRALFRVCFILRWVIEDTLPSIAFHCKYLLWIWRWIVFASLTRKWKLFVPHTLGMPNVSIPLSQSFQFVDIIVKVLLACYYPKYLVFFHVSIWIIGKKVQFCCTKHPSDTVSWQYENHWARSQSINAVYQRHSDFWHVLVSMGAVYLYISLKLWPPVYFSVLKYCFLTQ